MADTPLPQSVHEIAEVIGRDKALYLIGQLPACGKRSWRVVLYVPKSLPVDHQLVRVLGWHDARRLVRVFGGEILQPSNCRSLKRAYRYRVIQRMAGEGVSSDEIARAVGLTKRRVNGVLAEKKAGPPRRGGARGSAASQNSPSASLQKHG